ncbi:baseplate multidomain protein megatron [Oceaniglobus roseus]|uniref:baseplate multidomain protein megatron n=1 Tax=Oceaniglobus roseus TaxID=1737570 RepID=UPI000C7F3DE6|nr:glycoside hydrolase/phage tail family protein [Kandeliimicrobium roseum]
MATLVLSAVGAAAGASLGGGVLGLSSVVIGRAVGATLGRVIDQSILGSGSQAVETGRVERFRLTGASEGAPVAQVFGRTRVGGQVIWATRFKETATTSGGGKGAPSAPRTTRYAYSVSLAIALCEGEISRVGRIWIDGSEAEREGLNLRVYPGSDDQLPDPKIEAVEGAGMAPAYRGISYVVIEDLDLAPYGNRVPQFSFEVMRPEPASGDRLPEDLTHALQAVAIIPGTGEYALATTPVYFSEEPGLSRAINVNSPLGRTDFAASLEALTGELPRCGAASLVVSWFGNDLRCGRCEIRPLVEQTEVEVPAMPWRAGGLARAEAGRVPLKEGRVVYGGTPTDRSVVEAIAALREAGQAVTFYPFVLMTQQEGNGLPDPYSDAPDQPVLPWRGRITLDIAPGREGTSDGTAAAEAEVSAFFGAAQVSDFAVEGTSVAYSGPSAFGYRRFILHYAHLCKAAGGVSAFLIGSELRGLTWIRGAGGSFPAVAALRQLAADVREVLGPQTKISYAADWSEYFGYHPKDGSGDVFFHLDPLWSDQNVDFVGIDNYMPLSDWRDGFDHADAAFGSIYSLDYLTANVAGGEGFDWYYHAPEAEAVQLRTPITDGRYDEPWVFRYKDLRNWWSRPHHDRPGGVRSETPTGWVPESKPIWFTEYGCAAVDKGANQPNRFVDPKSSESGLPKYSNGRRDDFMQMQYLRAINAFWGDSANNPISSEYGGPMIDLSRAHVWAWDARPFPFFPGNTELWSDGENHARGHWITGRVTSRALSSVVRELCAESGVTAVDLDRLYGVVRGYALNDVAGARAKLQPLMTAYAFDAVEREGRLVFRTRTGRIDGVVEEERVAVSPDLDGDVEALRGPEAETAGRLRLSHVAADGNFEVQTAEAIFPDERGIAVSQTEMPLVLTRGEAAAIVERWLAEARVARDRLRFALPPSALALGAGDIAALRGGLYRIDRVEQSDRQLIEAVRIEPELYEPSDAVETAVRLAPFVAPVPVLPVFMDLPLIRSDQQPEAPYLAVTARPWPGSVALYDSPLEDGFELNGLIGSAAVVGTTRTPMYRARAGLIDRGPALQVSLLSGALESVTLSRLLEGANAMAIGSGTDDLWEVFQFGQANLLDTRLYALSRRLRGQAGTDGVMPDEWPVGSRVVLLNAAVGQISLAPASLGLARTYRVGPAGRPVDDPVYVQTRRAFDGVGLRPYAPAHLTLRAVGDNIAATWIRRTRIDGDSWTRAEVPLGEESELYLLRVVRDGAILREATVGEPAWTYGAAARAADGAGDSFAVEVAQVSAAFGPGPFTRRVFGPES